MKKLVLALVTALMTLAAWAQTPEEILDRMSKAMEGKEAAGMAMTMEMKIPILGTVHMRVCTLGDKTRMDVKMRGKEGVIWEDGDIQYAYNAKKNEITIEGSSPHAGNSSEAEDNLGLATGVTEGYDVKLLKETGEAWFFECKKQKTNKDKDAPKKINVSVLKGSYFLKEMSTSIRGAAVVMKDFDFNVTERDVTFDRNQYPDARIVDKRDKR